MTGQKVDPKAAGAAQTGINCAVVTTVFTAARFVPYHSPHAASPEASCSQGSALSAVLLAVDTIANAVCLLLTFALNRCRNPFRPKSSHERPKSGLRDRPKSSLQNHTLVDAPEVSDYGVID